MRVSIRKKLTLSFLLVALLVGVLGFFGYSNLKDTSNQVEVITELETPALVKLFEMKSFILESVEEAFAYPLLDDPLEKVEFFDNLARFDTSVAEFRGIAHIGQSGQGEETELIEQIVIAREAMAISARNMFESYERDGAVNPSHVAAFEADIDNVITLIDQFLEIEKEEVAEAQQDIQATIANAERLTLIVVSVAVLLAIGLGIFVSRTISIPINKLKAAAEELGKGNLGIRAKVESGDEIGSLATSFNQMAAALQQGEEQRAVLVAQRQRAHANLEAKVTERTLQLEASKERLEASKDNLVAEMNERQRLEEGERLRSQELAGADEVARIITSTLDIDQVAEKFALEVKKLVDYDRASINVIDLKAGTVTLKCLFGPARPGRPLGSVRPFEGSHTQQIIQKGQSLVQADIASDLTFPREREFLDSGLSSSIGVQLISKGQPIGTLILRSQGVGAYGPREQAILERLAKQIAPAIENSQLYGRLQANMEEMDLADEVARIVTSTLYIDEVYEKFALEVKKLVDFDRMSINLIDLEAGTQTLKYFIGLARGDRPVGSVHSIQDTYSQTVLDTGQTLRIEDAADYVRYPSDPVHAKNGMRATIRVPLISNGRIMGTMSLRSKQVGAFGPREQAILERLASQIAPAMENARLHEERVRAEEHLAQAQKMESVGQLAGGVAHDFNNLLTAIMGYSQLSLREAPPESPISNHLQEIQKAAVRAADLTHQLLAFSRRQVIEPKVIDLNDLIINLEMLRRLIGEDIELVTLPANDLAPVKADPGQIEQVLINLAVNARDAMPAGGKLTIETANVTLDAEYVRQHGAASPGRHVMLAVSDTGMGMSEEVQAHIFEPFFTTKEVGKGTGLGLATCYGIVRQSGGHIEVYSEPGQGTSFKVYLPVTEDAFEAQPKIVDASISPQGMETVLLAEDEPSVRSMVATVLRNQGYMVLEASNGEEALRMAQKHDGAGIELLLTDMVMPQMSGSELAEQLHVTHPEIKVLFTSGYLGDSGSHLDYLPTGTEFLAKPYMPDTLAVKVREVLDR